MRFETRCKITAFLRPDQILHLGKSKVQNTVIQHVVILRLGKNAFLWRIGDRKSRILNPF